MTLGTEYAASCWYQVSHRSRFLAYELSTLISSDLICHGIISKSLIAPILSQQLTYEQPYQYHRTAY